MEKYPGAVAKAALRSRRRSEGKCRSCEEKAEPGKSSCKKHLEAQRGYNRKNFDKRLAAGLCTKPKCKDKPIPNKTLCPKHMKEASQRSIRVKQNKVSERVNAGLCSQCGERRPRPGYGMCYICQAVARSYQQHRQEIKQYERDNPDVQNLERL